VAVGALALIATTVFPLHGRCSNHRRAESLVTDRQPAQWRPTSQNSMPTADDLRTLRAACILIQGTKQMTVELR
jgi:hypothetical protein